MKKFLSILMAIMMVAMLGITAFAASGDETDGNKGTITIDNAVVGQTYSIYRILKLESFNTELGAYSYKATENWSAFINSDGIKGTYVNVDTQGYVTWKDGAEAAAFAKLALDYAKTKPITAEATATATETTVTFADLAYGYYLVDSSLGTLCSLDTTVPTVTIKEKNATPTLVKTVWENSTGNYGSANDEEIFENVLFKITIGAKKGAHNYVVHDTLASALTFKNDVVVKVGETTVAADNYEVKTGLTDGCTFEIQFKQAYLDTIEADTTIDITYSASFNAAATSDTKYENTAYLAYGDNSKTVNSTTTTYTYDVDLFKYCEEVVPGETNGNGTETTNKIQKALAGAEFVLYYETTDSTTTVKHYAKVETTSGKITGWTDDKAQATTLVSGADGKIHVIGLDKGTYYFEETKAPNGYNILANPVNEIIVDGTGDTTVEVLNQTGSQLPSTGGIGTTIFYVVGGILMAGAVVLLVTKKKMSVK